MFCGAKLKTIKKTKNIIHDKIVVSTCYFPAISFNLYDKPIEYINELIANIETFDIKIKQFTSNPEKWVYRVYIDETIFNMENIINNVITKDELNDKKLFKKYYHKYYIKSLKNKTSNNLINELDYKFTDIRHIIINNYNLLIFQSKLVNEYINRITKSGDSKYNNIEIITYDNPELHLHKLTNKRLSLMLDRAARAAAITVSRFGALPPGRDEI